MQRHAHVRRRRRAAIVLGAALLALGFTGGSARAASLLTPGAVFTESNDPAGNAVRAFTRNADGTLDPAGEFSTGGTGRSPNPPSAFPVLDSGGPVELSEDGDNRSCLFAVNAGSNDVTSFRVGPDTLEQADIEESGGSRPVSVTSTSRGAGKQVLYVLNSDEMSASIQGYYVSNSCELTPIGSAQLTPSQNAQPAQVRFDEHGRFLVVSERYAGGGFPVGGGDIVVYPVGSDGVVGAPVVNPSPQRTPYGLDFNHQGILSVTNENFPDVPSSTVSTYEVNDDGTLVPLDTEPSPGAACWNVFTNDGRFLYVTNPVGKQVGGTNVKAFRVDRDGTMTLIDSDNTPYDSIDNALSHDSRYLYVLSATIIEGAPASAIDAWRIDPETGTIEHIDQEQMDGNTTSGLAAW